MAEMAALEGLQQPDDKSLSKTALRLLQGLLGVQPDTSVNVVDADGIKDRVESLEEKLNEAIVSREQLSDFVNDIVDKRIQHLVDALSDHENRLLGIEQAQQMRLPSPVTAKATKITEEDTRQERAIAPGEITNKKYFVCQNCSNEGYEDVDFTKEGYTKAGTQRWKCGRCKNVRSETSITKTK
jgi:septum formation inhibitor MinC